MNQSGIAQALDHFDRQKSVCLRFGHNSEMLGPNSKGQLSSGCEPRLMAGGDGNRPVGKIGPFDRYAASVRADDLYLPEIAFWRTDESRGKQVGGGMSEVRRPSDRRAS